MPVFVRAAAVFLFFVAVGCRGDARVPAEGPIVRIGFGIGASARASGVNVLAHLLFTEPLIVHDWFGRPRPRLISDWTTNPEGTKLDLRLKQGVRFHDGAPVSAETVVRLLRNQAEKKRFGFDFVTSITAHGEDRISMTLSNPDLFLLPALNEITLTHPENSDIATGPFKLSSREPVVETRRFDDYHGGRSDVAGVQIRIFDTQRSAWAALMRGEVDVVQEVARDSVEFLEASSNIAAYPSVQGFYLALALNQEHPVLRNVEVRRALAESIDRAAIIERAMRGKGRIANDPIWPFHWAYPADAPQHEFNPKTAAERLDRSGYALPPQGKQGQQRKRLSFKCMVYNEDPQFERIALLIQRQLFDVGVVMDVQLVDLDTMLKRFKAGDYDAFLMQMYSGRALDYLYRFWRSGAPEAQMVNSGYIGADDILDDLRHSLSDDRTAQLVKGVVERLHRDVPSVFLAWTEVTRAVSTRFDVGDATKQDPLFNIWQWRPREVSASR